MRISMFSSFAGCACCSHFRRGPALAAGRLMCLVITEWRALAPSLLSEHSPSVRLADMNLDVPVQKFRRLLRRVVGPPTDISWDRPWHEILHLWHAKVRQVCEHYSLFDWATTALKQYWKLAAYVVSLPQDRWICRVLNCRPVISDAEMPKGDYNNHGMIS